MRNRGRLLAVALTFAAVAASAQEPASRPLSVIDWLGTPADTPQPTPVVRIDEPDTSVSAGVPDVTVQPLGSVAAKRVGLAPAEITGLPDTLWSNASGAALRQAIASMPHLSTPALRSLYVTLLLAEAAPPATDAVAFDLARLDALVAAGALDPAIALLDQIGPTRSPAHFARAADLALLSGSAAVACDQWRAAPHLSPGTPFDVFCTARAGHWQDAVLLLGTSRALGLVSDDQAALLERFLDPEIFEGTPPPPVPAAPDALTFRLFQAIGAPIPTRGLPVIYANADLSDTAGWKAQLEAAERLAQHGALPGNRLLGLYAQRAPAASGGIWDRVAAVQRFDTALRTQSPAAVSKTLPAAWRHMRAARLAPLFAQLFAERLSALVLSGAAADTAFDVLLLSSRYETAATLLPARALQRPVPSAVAAGAVPPRLRAEGLAGAVLAAFDSAEPDAQIVAQAQSGALGLAILRTLRLTQAGAAGDVAQLTKGLATLRALGLEDVARRTGLQVLLLTDPT